MFQPTRITDPTQAEILWENQWFIFKLTDLQREMKSFTTSSLSSCEPLLMVTKFNGELYFFAAHLTGTHPEYFVEMMASLEGHEIIEAKIFNMKSLESSRLNLLALPAILDSSFKDVFSHIGGCKQVIVMTSPTVTAFTDKQYTFESTKPNSRLKLR